jgi:hypothetical protein
MHEPRGATCGDQDQPRPTRARVDGTDWLRESSRREQLARVIIEISEWVDRLCVLTNPLATITNVC